MIRVLTQHHRALLAIITAMAISACDSPPSALDKEGDQVTGHAELEPVFTEMAADAGLDFQHFLGATGDFFPPEIIGAGGAFLDYDNDGDLDVLLVQGKLLDEGKELEQLSFPAPRHPPGHRLFRNQWHPEGKLAFVDVTDSAGLGQRDYGMGVAVGDINNDSFADIYITSFGSNRLLLNRGNGSFEDITATAGVDDPRWSTGASFLDFDRDGDLDLFVTNYVNFTLQGNKRCFTSAGRRDYCGPMSFEAVPDRLFRNEGNNQFVDVSSASGIDKAFGSGLGVISADYDSNGWADIYVANDGRPNQLWMNQGDGTFQDTSLMSGTALNINGKAEASMGVTAGDFDGDGDEDLFMTHLDGETNTLYVNQGKADFFDMTSEYGLSSASFPFTGFGSQWFDLDNDSDLDLFIANGAVRLLESIQDDPYPYRQKNQLFRYNQNMARFEDISAVSGAAMQLSEVSRGAAFGDVDNDGDIDILVSNNNGPPRLLLNNSGNLNPWLTLKLEGTTSNRDAIGAIVGLVRKNQPVLWRRAHRDGSYLSSRDARVHFGLGEHQDIETVIVKWPSGKEESWPGITANRISTLQEGTGTVRAEPAR